MGSIILAQFRPPATADVTAPVISNIDSEPGWVSWDLDEPGTGQVEWGTGSGGGYNATVLATSNLVGYWRLGEASGTSADDDSGYGRTGTYVNSPLMAQTGAVGDSDTAVDFTGSVPPKYVSVAGYTVLPSTAVTIEGWVKITSAVSGLDVIAGWYSSSALQCIVYVANTDQVSFTLNGTATTYDTAGDVNDGTWHHVVATYDGTYSRLYYEGALVAGPTAVTYTGGTSTYPFQIGNYGNEYTAHFAGLIDEVAVYSRCLTPAEITAHYDSIAGGGSTYGNMSTLETSLLTHHEQSIPGLLEGYHFRVLSEDAHGNLATSADQTVPAATSRPWALPTTTATYVVPALGSGDVTTALNSYIASVPDGSIIDLGTATYHISGCIDLRGRNHLIFQGTSAVAPATIISSAPGEPAWASCFSTMYPSVFPGDVSTHITIRYIDFTGANLTPGHMSSSGEHNHFLQICNGSYYEIANCTLQGMHGDIAAIRDNGQYLWVHDNVVPDCGRNFVSVVWGSHVLVERNTLGLAGWSIFDIEPNAGASDGSTMTDIIFRDNTAENWSSLTGFFFGNCSGLNSSANVDSVTITRNTITARSLFSLQGRNTTGRRTNTTFTNNTGIATPVYQAMPGMISFWRSDGVTVTGNTQPRISGDTKPLVYVDPATCTQPIVVQSS